MEPMFFAKLNGLTILPLPAEDGPLDSEMVIFALPPKLIQSFALKSAFSLVVNRL